MPTSFWVVVSANCGTCLADPSGDILSPWEPLSCERQLGRCLGYEREPRPPSGMRRLICKRICDCECLLKMYLFEMLLVTQMNVDIWIHAEIGCRPGAVEIWVFLVAGRWSERPFVFFKPVLVCGWLCGVFEFWRHFSLFVSVCKWLTVPILPVFAF